ncbi:MAG: hypothetical protein GY810_19650 [Aureispira sp.]|nr:hypothetical protein [Aureispira sp.]
MAITITEKLGLELMQEKITTWIEAVQDNEELMAQQATTVKLREYQEILPNVRRMLEEDLEDPTLDEQVQKEANQDRAKIILLYKATLKADEITAMLDVQNDATELLKLVQPVKFKISDMLYGSATGGKFGSLYFKGGRIRFTHSSGPQISDKHADITRYTINEDDYTKYSIFKGRLLPYIENCLASQRKINDVSDANEDEEVIPFRGGPIFAVSEEDLEKWEDWRANFTKPSKKESYDFVMALGSCKPASPSNSGNLRLIEFFGKDGKGGSHPSRGMPTVFNFVNQQVHLNIMYNLAAQKNNSILYNMMQAHPILKKIPINNP